MIEYKLKAWGEEFTLSNNNEKFDRAAQEVGDKATPEAFLGAYDKRSTLQDYSFYLPPLIQVRA